jgi:hypothetical protein
MLRSGNEGHKSKAVRFDKEEERVAFAQAKQPGINAKERKRLKMLGAGHHKS